MKTSLQLSMFVHFRRPRVTCHQARGSEVGGLWTPRSGAWPGAFREQGDWLENRAGHWEGPFFTDRVSCVSYIYLLDYPFLDIYTWQGQEGAISGDSIRVHTGSGA